MELPSLEAWKADVSGVIPVVFAMTKVERPKYQVFNLLTVDFVNVLLLHFLNATVFFL